MSSAITRVLSTDVVPVGSPILIASPREQVLKTVSEVNESLIPKGSMEPLDEINISYYVDILREKGIEGLWKEMHMVQMEKSRVWQVFSLMFDYGYDSDRMNRLSRGEWESYAKVLEEQGPEVLIDRLFSGLAPDDISRSIERRVRASRKAREVFERALKVPVDPACKAGRRWHIELLSQTSSGFEAQFRAETRVVQLSLCAFNKNTSEHSISKALDIAFTYALFELINSTRSAAFLDLDQEVRTEGARIARLSAAEREARIVAASNDLARRAEAVEHQACLEHSKVIKEGIASGGQFKPFMDIFGGIFPSFDEEWERLEHTSHAEYWRKEYRTIIETEIARLLGASPPASDRVAAPAAAATSVLANAASASPIEGARGVAFSALLAGWRAREAGAAAAEPARVGKKGALPPAAAAAVP